MKKNDGNLDNFADFYVFICLDFIELESLKLQIFKIRIFSTPIARRWLFFRNILKIFPYVGIKVAILSSIKIFNYPDATAIWENISIP